MKKTISILAVFLMAASVHGQTLVDTVLNKVSNSPFYFSVPATDGNYRVTVTLGSKKRAAHTVVKAEIRRLFVEGIDTKK